MVLTTINILDYEILSYLTDKELEKILTYHPLGPFYDQDPNFWLDRLTIFYPGSVLFKPKDLNFKDYYNELTEHSLDDTGANFALAKGSFYILEYLISIGCSFKISRAFWNDRLEIFKWLNEKGYPYLYKDSTVDKINDQLIQMIRNLQTEKDRIITNLEYLINHDFPFNVTTATFLVGSGYGIWVKKIGILPAPNAFYWAVWQKNQTAFEELIDVWGLKPMEDLMTNLGQTDWFYFFEKMAEFNIYPTKRVLRNQLLSIPNNPERLEICKWMKNLNNINIWPPDSDIVVDIFIKDFADDIKLMDWLLEMGLILEEDDLMYIVSHGNVRLIKWLILKNLENIDMIYLVTNFLINQSNVQLDLLRWAAERGFFPKEKDLLKLLNRSNWELAKIIFCDNLFSLDYPFTQNIVNKLIQLKGYYLADKIILKYNILPSEEMWSDLNFNLYVCTDRLNKYKIYPSESWLEQAEKEGQTELLDYLKTHI